MMIKRFEDAISWQKGEELTERIYKQFKYCKDFSFKDQVQRASISIMNNIAEGFERQSKKELKYFLFIAKGSCGEVRSMLYLVLKFKYITKEEFKENYNLSIEISKLLSGFIKTLKTN